MKHLLLPVLKILVCCAPVSIYGADRFTDSIVIIRKDPPPKNGRLHLPANPNAGIICTYGRGWLRLELPMGVYQSTVTLTSATYRWEGLATTEQPYTEIPELEGPYTLIIRTDDNQTYSGSIEF